MSTTKRRTYVMLTTFFSIANPLCLSEAQECSEKKQNGGFNFEDGIVSLITNWLIVVMIRRKRGIDA